MKKLKPKREWTPVTVLLLKHLLKSIYLDGDKQMWVCTTHKDMTLLLPRAMSPADMHRYIVKVNNGQGIYIETPEPLKAAPRQLNLFAEPASANPS